MSELNVTENKEYNTETILCFNYEKHIKVYTEDIVETYNNNNYLFNKE